MDFLAVLSIVLGVLGILGGLLPVLPGPPLSWIALLCAYLSSSASDPVSRTALFVWLAVAVAITILDYILPGWMTKLTGGHKTAERGAMAGLLVGLFFTPVGMIAGSFIGALIGELISQNNSDAPTDIAKALKAAAGTFLAFLLSTGVKTVFGAVMLWRVIVCLF